MFICLVVNSGSYPLFLMKKIVDGEENGLFQCCPSFYFYKNRKKNSWKVLYLFEYVD